MTWINAVRPPRQPLRGFLRMTDTLKPSLACVMVRSVPAKPGRVSNHAQRRGSGISFREETAMAQIGTGKYTYEVIHDFFKLPAGPSFCPRPRRKLAG